MKKAFYLLFAVFFAVLLGGGEFRVAATADIHGNLWNLAALAPAIRAAKPDIIVDAGDLIGGNAAAEYDGGRAMIEALDLLHCAFRVPGNHDFETPHAAFCEAFRRFRGVTLGNDWQWGKGVSGAPFRIVTKGRFRCAVIGLTEPDLQRRFLPGGESPRFFPWEETLKRTLAELRRQQVHFILLVWHNGIDSRPGGVAAVIRNFPEINAVVAAHSHKEEPGRKLGNCYVIQPGAYALSAGVLRIVFDDRSGRAERIESELLRGDRSRPAGDLAALARKSSSRWYAMGNRKICRKGELGPRRFPGLAAQALAAAGNTPGAVFSCRTPNREAEEQETFMALHRLIPFRNMLCTMELTKDELRALMEELSRGAARFGRSVAVCGFTWQSGGKRRSGFFRAPERLRVTLSDYTMVSSPTLRRVMGERPGCWQPLRKVEHDAVAEFLSSRR